MRRVACSVSPLTAASAAGFVTVGATADRARKAARKMTIPTNAAIAATSQVVTLSPSASSLPTPSSLSTGPHLSTDPAHPSTNSNLSATEPDPTILLPPCYRQPQTTRELGDS